MTKGNWFLLLALVVANFAMFRAAQQVKKTTEIFQDRITHLEEYIEENGLPTPALRYRPGMTLMPGESVTITREIQ